MQPARAKAELMLLKPQDVKGDKAHLRVKVREKVKFAKSLLPHKHSTSRRSPAPCAKSRREGIPVMQELCRGSPLTHPSWSSLRVCSQPGHLLLTCSSLIKVETLNRLWRSKLQQSPQARLNTLQKDIQKRSLGICLSIITDQLERHHPWEVSGRVMKFLAFLGSKFFAQTHPSTSSDGPTAQPSPTAPEHCLQLLIKSCDSVALA